ncbi:hypothetical protein BKA62DRAFT_681137 [Auriculariales sp. MPI-PUGE-AT-0066]|nr:hypothetical protein BKA62DRAFT_681137 [Auriculariales sp. MPI-PUGE-AT-0066]
MAYYSQYQAMPGWGSQQYAFAAPPAPTYQPQPTWRGADYYSAHYGQPDNSLFDYVWSRVRGAFVGIGVGKEEAKYWHRRVYGGMADIPGMEPRHVGAAAGYEALRIWQYHKAIYRQPLSDDHEREREALAGLAVGEGSKLWQYTGRFSDKYGRREACEVAAATAARIFNEKYDYDSYEAYESYGGRSRRNSFVGGSAVGGYGYGEEDPYHEDAYGGRRRQRRMSTSSAYDYDSYPARPTSAMGYAGSAVGAPMLGGSMVGTPYAGAGALQPMGAVGATPYAAASPYMSAQAAYGGYGGAAGAYPGAGGAYGVASPYAGAGYGAGAGAYGVAGAYPTTAAYAAAAGQQYAPSLGSSYGMDPYGRPRGNSYYGGGGGGYPGY